MKISTFKKVRTLSAAGMTFEEIANALNSEGVKTPTGKVWSKGNLYNAYRNAEANDVGNTTPTEVETEVTPMTRFKLTRDQIVEVLSSNLSATTKKTVIVATL